MSIQLEGVTKRFESLVVVDDVSLSVADGELFVLLGPSGSGKSTILRLIAGLSVPDRGRILLHGLDVTGLPPQARGTGFVFQNYSLFRHMTVAGNIEFGLRLRKVGRSERARKRDELLELVEMSGLGERFPDQLSGGQRQRVALARALAYEPAVLLLDEPFGALDVKIRAQLRRSLKAIQRRLGLTAILVTHDQEEAFELADRLAVMEGGRLHGLDTPEALYERPSTQFVATFLGGGTVLTGRVADGLARFGDLALPIPPDNPHDDGGPVQLLVRPEHVLLAEAPPAGLPVLGRARLVEQSFTGPTRRVRLRLPRPAATRQVAPRLPFGEEDLVLEASLPAGEAPPPAEPWVGLRRWHILQPPRPHLLVYDAGEGSAAGLALAAALGERLKGALTLLGVAGEPAGVAALREQLNERAAAAGLVPTELRVRTGDAATEALAEAAEVTYTLLVVPADELEAGWLGRSGGVLPALLSRSRIPVLVAREGRPDVRRVLICTAAGEPGKQDVRIGGRLARRVGAEVTLLYIVTPEAGGTNELVRTHLSRADATLRALDVVGAVHVRPAPHPAAGILAEAVAGDHDLIVVGGHVSGSRHRIGREDVTLQVVLGADRPVLVVPELGER
jgi:sulfate transport system ATP-binding protein